ncbi:MAG TPA: tRNA epoxyqueuosine(34) reductase QueG [Pseudogracilibacillus sp.]|nr:tRNA epoxyqueuosine(34) reductase QueG [Pseudogracilibacillus sp.]
MTTFQELKEAIIAHSKEIGIDKIGFTTADPFTELKRRLIEQERLQYKSGFEKGSIEERTEPKRLLPGAQSIIAIALAYPTKLKDAPKSKPGARRGIFSRTSWGTDYHVVLRERLEKLAAFIEDQVTDFSYKIMVDTGELSDRAVAERAGIGFSGKNASIITEEFGSFVYLGEMITNIPFEPDEPVELSCGDCRICLDACPTGALVQGGQLNAQRCLSFLSQTKVSLPEPFREKLGTRLYGCDTCQLVCPFNKQIDFHLHEEFEPEPEVAKPLLQPMLQKTNREFREKFGHISGFWRGKNPLQRNAIIALAHYKDETAIDLLKNIVLKDVRPVIRETAIWALGKIGTDEAKEALEEMLKKIDDSTLQEKVRDALFTFETT